MGMAFEGGGLFRFEAGGEGLLQLGDLGVAAGLAAGEDALAVDVDVEIAAAGGDQAEVGDVFTEGVEQLVGDPEGAREEVAAPAVGNGDGEAAGHGTAPPRGYWRLLPHCSQ